MSNNRQRGIDGSHHTQVAWCACGWREMGIDRADARRRLAEHAATVHDIAAFNYLKRVPRQEKDT